MNEPHDPISDPHRTQFQNESLADVMPTPVNDDRLPHVINFGIGTVTLVVAGAGSLFLLAATTAPCVGATQSTKLEWERRQLLMEQAEQAVAQADLNDAQSHGGTQN